MLPKPNGSEALPPVAFVPVVGRREPPVLVNPPELMLGAPGVAEAVGVPGTAPVKEVGNAGGGIATFGVALVVAPGTAPAAKGLLLIGAEGDMFVLGVGV